MRVAASISLHTWVLLGGCATDPSDAILDKYDGSTGSTSTASSSSLLRLACRVVGRDFSDTEWATLFPGEPQEAVCGQR